MLPAKILNVLRIPVFIATFCIAFLGHDPDGTLFSAGADDGVFSANQWKVTLPIANKKGTAREIANPEFSSMLEKQTFAADVKEYFRVDRRQAVFRTAYTGVTTSGDTEYCRCELREMNDGDEQNWKLSTGGKMSARLKVSDLKQGAKKLIVLQIHGLEPESKPLLKILWEKGAIRIITKSGDKLKDYKKQQRYTAIEPGEWFTCEITANRDAVNVMINGKMAESFGTEVLKNWPTDNTYYFKAGNYLQHDTPGAEATVVFSSLKISH